MKINLERSALLKALGHLHRVVERRNTIPILANVLIKARAQALILRATDLDLEVSESIPADVEREGGTTLPAHTFFEIIRKLPDGAQVSLEMNGDSSQILVRSGRSRFQLQCLPESDFPDLNAGTISHHFSFPASDFAKMIEHTQFTISNEETRYYLTGIYFHTLEIEGKNFIRAVATDGHRLALFEAPAPEEALGMPGIIVPRKAVAEILKLVESAQKDLEIELSSTKIRLTYGTIILTSKLIDGTFPDYVRVIPKNNDKYLTVDRIPFTAAVDRVSTISSERGRAVKLSLSDHKLTLSVNNPDAGSAVEELDVDYNADSIEIGFNARYLLEILAQLSGDTALFKLSDSGSSTLIQNHEGAADLYVLMPMRV